MSDTIPAESTALARLHDAQSTTVAELEVCPLGSLRLSPLNPRETAVSDAEVASLAESIALLGLLQNLIGYAEDGAPGTVLVAGGGLRLRALQRLAIDGRIGRDELVPVMVHRSAEAAVEAAIAENEVRRPMTALDQYNAYRAMRDAGHGPQRIAAANGTDEAQVRRVLALDRVSNLVRAALGRGELTLDQARAFTVEPDILAQNTLLGRWKLLNPWEREPDSIRRQLRDRGDARRVTAQLEAVGRETYVEAGGSIARDLFSPTEMVEDRGILDRLFRAHVDRLAAAALAEGWAWAEYRDAGVGSDEEILEPVGWTPTAEEDAFLDRVDEARANGYRLDPDDVARAEALHALAVAPADWTADQKSVAGVAVWLPPGWRSVQETRGVVRAADVDRAAELGLLVDDCALRKRASDGTAPPDEREREQADKPGTGSLSEALRSELRSVRTVATANAVAADPALALDLLAWLTTLPVYPSISCIRGGQGHVHGAEGLGLPRGFELVGQAATRVAAETFAAFRARGAAHRDALLARWVAQSLDAIDDKRGGGLFAELEAEAGVRLRDAWTPGEAFLKRLTTAQLDALHRELTGEPHPLTAARKAEQVKLLADLFEDAARRGSLPGLEQVNAWLPAPLRRGGDAA